MPPCHLVGYYRPVPFSWPFVPLCGDSFLLAMPKLQTECPSCQASNEVEEALVGRQAKCAGCGNDFIVLGGTPSQLGRYQLVRKLGQGGMGAVYEAIQEGLERRVAVKVLPAALMADKDFVERFKREARAAAKLNHPNIVTIHEISQDHGFHFFSMEFVDGQSLEQQLQKESRLPVAEAIALMQQALQGLAHAWEQGIIHRDLKPANLMLTRRGVLKVADFGLAKALEMSSNTMTGAGMGTPYYMSPEQGSNAKNVDLRADIYSLGATFYHLVTGRVPFEGTSPFEVAIKVATAPLPPVCEVNPDVPAPVAAMIEKMLARDPDQRHHSADELLSALSSIADIGSARTQPAAKAREIASALAPSPVKGGGQCKEVSIDLGGGVKMEFVLIPMGSFLMGSEKGRPDEKPVHKVTISKPFYLGKYPVTQEQWQAVMGNNPSGSKGPSNPVEYLSWDDCESFCAKLKAKAPGKNFRLPTEAEWEYACRAGSKTEFCFGDDEAGLDEFGWCMPKSGGTHPVGGKKSNAWGLYDMHGNQDEWCSDWYGEDYYTRSPEQDPPGPPSGQSRVLRGGSWLSHAVQCRAAFRSKSVPTQRRIPFFSVRLALDFEAAEPSVPKVARAEPGSDESSPAIGSPPATKLPSPHQSRSAEPGWRPTSVFLPTPDGKDEVQITLPPKIGGSLGALAPNQNQRPQVRLPRPPDLVRLSEIQVLRVGRGDDVDKQVDDDQMSRLHFQISHSGTGYVCKDLNSRNGTWVNGDRITETTLKSEDKIQAGQTVFVFREGPPAMLVVQHQE